MLIRFAFLIIVLHSMVLCDIGQAQVFGDNINIVPGPFNRDDIGPAQKYQFYDRGDMTSDGSGGMKFHVRSARASDYTAYGNFSPFGGYGYYLDGEFDPALNPGRFATYQDFLNGQPNTPAQSSIGIFDDRNAVFAMPSRYYGYKHNISRSGNVITIDSEKISNMSMTTGLYIPPGWYESYIDLGRLDAGNYKLIYNQSDKSYFGELIDNNFDYVTEGTGFLNFTVQAIPEPSSVVFIGLGMIVASGLYKRRQHKLASRS